MEMTQYTFRRFYNFWFGLFGFLLLLFRLLGRVDSRADILVIFFLFFRADPNFLRPLLPECHVVMASSLVISALLQSLATSLVIISTSTSSLWANQAVHFSFTLRLNSTPGKEPRAAVGGEKKMKCESNWICGELGGGLFQTAARGARGLD